MSDCMYFPGDLRTEEEMDTVLAHCRAGNPVDVWACACRLYTTPPHGEAPSCAACEDAALRAPSGRGPALRLVAAVRVSVPLPPAAGGR